MSEQVTTASSTLSQSSSSQAARTLLLKQREAAIRSKFSKPWIKDEDSKTCFLCRKEFNFLYRRKHHCRKCGQVFCSVCSNYFLSQLIDPSKEVSVDKDTRLCQTCFFHCKEFIESDTRVEGTEDVSDEDSNDEELYPAEQSTKLQTRQDIKSTFEGKVRLLIQHVFASEKKLANLSDEQIDETFDFTLHCVRYLRLRRQPSGEGSKYHQMDINQNVMIRTALHKDACRIRFINGIINAKNVAKKNMCVSFGVKKEKSNSNNFNKLRSGSGSNLASFDSNSGPIGNSPMSMAGSSNTNNYLTSSPNVNGGISPGGSGSGGGSVRCMVIGVSVDLFSPNEANFPDLQQIIAKQRAHVSRIVEGFKQYKPQIIFCKENVNQDVLAALENAQITVVQKIKQHNILRIAECAGCKIVDDISSILPRSMSNGQPQTRSVSQAMLDKKLLGYLQSVNFKTYQFATSQKTYMFLEQPDDKSTPQHVSMLITGPNLETLRQFKKSLQDVNYFYLWCQFNYMHMKVILRLVRHLYLEQEMIFMNHEIIKANKKARKLYVASLENDFVDFGNLNNFLDEKMGLTEYVTSDSMKFSYVHISYSKQEWDQFAGVASREEFDKYTQDKKLNYDHMKINTLVKYCGDFQLQQLNFYSINDISLGDILLKIYNERITACGHCKRPMFNHYNLYVRNKSYVRLSVIERLDPTLSSPNQGSSSSNSNTSNANNSHGHHHHNHPLQATQQFLGISPSNASSSQSHPHSSVMKQQPQQQQQQLLQQQQQQQLQAQEQMQMQMRKKKYLQKDQVLSYIRCEQCNQCITPVHKSVLSRTYMDYSFSRFLQHLFQEHAESYKRDRPSIAKESRPLPGDTSISQHQNASTVVASGKCQHAVNSRIFNIKDVEIQFQSGLTTIYSIKRVFITSEAVTAAVRESDNNYYRDSYISMKILLKSLLQEATLRLSNLVEIVTRQKAPSSKLALYIQVQDVIKHCIETMERERDSVIAKLDNAQQQQQLLSSTGTTTSNTIAFSSYQSLMPIFILEQRIHIGLEKIHSLEKDIFKKKFKQFDKQADEQINNADLDNSALIDDEMLELNQQKYDYIPVYSKNILSTIAWALNTKTYGRFLKDHGLGVNQRMSRSYLLDSLKRKQNEGSMEERQIVEEYKLVIRMMKCEESQQLSRFDSNFIQPVNHHQNQHHHQSQQQQQQQQQQQTAVSSIPVSVPTIQQQQQQPQQKQTPITTTTTTTTAPNTSSIKRIRSASSLKILSFEQLNPTEKTNINQQLAPTTPAAITTAHEDTLSQKSHKSKPDSTNELDHIEGSKRIQAEAFHDFDDDWPKFKLKALRQSQPDGLCNLPGGALLSSNQELANEPAVNPIFNSSIRLSQSKEQLQMQKRKTLPPRNKTSGSLSSQKFQRSLNNLFFQGEVEEGNELKEVEEEEDCAKFKSSQLKSKQQLTQSTQPTLQNNQSQPNPVSQSLQQLPPQQLPTLVSSQSQAAAIVNEVVSLPKKLPSRVQSHQSLNLNFGGTGNSNSNNGFFVTPAAVPSVPISPAAALINIASVPHQSDLMNAIDAANLLKQLFSKHASQQQQQQNQQQQQQQQSENSTQSAGMNGGANSGSANNGSGVTSSNINSNTNNNNNNNNNTSSSAEVQFEIHILFAKQFEAMRNLHGISLERIVESLRSCMSVKLPGGQTSSAFVKSHDELFIVKEVTQLEFNYFCGFATAYFEHVSMHVPQSILSRIFGMFEIRDGDERKCCVVMENLFYGVDKDACLSYDLKGSKLRRFNSKVDIGLDTNFMIDQNCEPLFIDNSTFQQFDKTIRVDSEFLAQHDIVDYSLLLIVDKQKKSLRMGIIDYFRKYDTWKQVENKIKILVYGEDPTIIQPIKYKDRFVKTITKKFFCKV